jgi:CRISP-associated protein Cas1
LWGVDAILNYAYAALNAVFGSKPSPKATTQRSASCTKAATIRRKFIFDLMEPERPKVDRAVLDFVKGPVFNPADFIIRSDGVCRLSPEMARMVVAKVAT